MNEEACLYGIDVLAKIKTKQAEQALLRLFDQTEDVTLKTLIADALCQHLSIEAIPKVKKLIKDGYDEMMLNLEESLYVNLVLSETNDPCITELRQRLEDEERRINERKSYIDSFSVQVKSPKIGRNDPCPCGSGKKYKKCCM